MRTTYPPTPRWTGPRRLLSGRTWRRFCAPLACAALTACATQPARLGGPSPGDYEAFMREVMVEAAKAPEAAPKSASRAVRSAAKWLGKGEGENTRSD